MMAISAKCPSMLSPLNICGIFGWVGLVDWCNKMNKKLLTSHGETWGRGPVHFGSQRFFAFFPTKAF
jgi:hypothetical protein